MHLCKPAWYTLCMVEDPIICNEPLKYDRQKLLLVIISAIAKLEFRNLRGILKLSFLCFFTDVISGRLFTLGAGDPYF